MAGSDELNEAVLAGRLPSDPLPLLQAWLHAAVARKLRTPDAVTLATVDPDGRPSARVVLCKELNLEQGWVTIYTNRRSRKGRSLEYLPYASVVFHWDPLARQARVEGPVTLTPDADSDSYFASRPLEAQLAAWASDQSEPIDSRESLLRKVKEISARFRVDQDAPAGASVPRPKDWGGYRVWAERVELWISRPNRLHDRAEWTRELTPEGDGFVGGPWRAIRLQP